MKKYKNSLFYALTIGICAILIYWVFELGGKLEIQEHIQRVSTKANIWNQFSDTISHNAQHPLSLLLFQIIIILIVAHTLGWLSTKIGQPKVIGEMIAGIILGPSFFGMYFPDLSNAIFPTHTLGNIQFLSQIGLLLFMFIVGMELDLKVLKSKATDAIMISHASIIFPFSLGILLSYFIYSKFAPENVPFISFALFVGISMSVTAFPVLARIVQEKGIHKTKLGTIAITCAAADDVTAWCILAVVIAIVKAGGFESSLLIILMAVIYVVIMIKIVRPLLIKFIEKQNLKTSSNKAIVVLLFIVLIISALIAEIIGIHALFGAFMAGAIMPQDEKLKTQIAEKIEDVALILLLPLFFVYTGLRTQIGLLNSFELWKMTGLIILVAVIGKFVGSALTAKYIGQTTKDSLILGALMNTRGLMELVVLNIGYDLGVLSPEIFAMLVIMALSTTFMTGPAISLIQKIYK